MFTGDDRWRITVMCNFTGYSGYRGRNRYAATRLFQLKSQKKRLHIFPVTDYHLRASGGAGTLAGPMAGKHL